MSRSRIPSPDPGFGAGLADAERSLDQLAGLRARLPGPEFPTRLLLYREAILSSRIADLRPSGPEVVGFEAAPPRKHGDDDLRQVIHHLQALEHGLAASRGRPVTLKLLRDLHRILMTGVQTGTGSPGRYRQTRTPPDPPGCMDAVAPPPGRGMRAALEDFEDELRAPADLPPLLRIALVHSRFERIHPFGVGNDRVGRMLIALLFQAWGLLPSAWLCLSGYFARHREEYCARVLAADATDGWEGWVGFFLAGVAVQSHDSFRRILELRELRDDYLARLHRAPSRASLAGLVAGLFERPALTTALTARRLQVTRREAERLLRRLVDSGILSTGPGDGRHAVFVAFDIVRAIEDAPEPGHS